MFNCFVLVACKCEPLLEMSQAPSNQVKPAQKRKKKRHRTKVKEQSHGKKSKSASIASSTTRAVDVSPSVTTGQSLPKTSKAGLTIEKVLQRNSKVVRRFYEPLVLLTVLEPVRGVLTIRMAPPMTPWIGCEGPSSTQLRLYVTFAKEAIP
jgi:hypothetical protein